MGKMESTSFWMGGMSPFLVIMGLIIGAAAFCLPGIVLLRSKDGKGGALCLVLGLLGVVFFIPWVAAVVIAARKGSFPDRRESFLSSTWWKLLGAAFGVLAAVQLFLGISDYRQAVSLAMEEIYVPVILEAVVNVASLLFVCLWMVIASCMKGRAFWGFQMALCGILPRCSVGRMAVLVQLLVLLLIFGGGMGIFLEVIRCAGKGQMAQEQLLEEENRQRSRSQVFQASGRIRCLAGQYAGMEIPIRDGETLCIGRDPNLAHLVITEGEIAPLHLELTFWRQEGCYQLVHRKENPVYRDGEPLPELCRLEPGSTISFGGLLLQSFCLE